MTIRISGWHVEGFGVLRDYIVQDIPAGLTVFSGPNEAGKSTLLAFIRGMLFGFPPATALAGHYPAVRGGRHGGKLFVTDANGERFTIDRQVGRRSIQVTREHGDASEEDLRVLLGGCDRQLFQSVFAFSLADLQELEGLNHDEVRERLALVGITGAGRSPSEAIRHLSERRSSQLGSGASRIAALREQLGAVTAALDQARREAMSYPDVRGREEAANARVAAIAGEIATIRAERDRAGALLRAWPDWLARHAAETSRDQIVLDEAIPSVAEDIAAVAHDLDRYQALQDRLTALEDHREAAARRLASRLRDLGPEWDRERLSAADPSASTMLAGARDFAEKLGQADDALTQATGALVAVREQVARTIREQANVEAQLSALASAAGADSIEERQAAIRRLRAHRSDLTSAEVHVQVARTSLEGLEELRVQSGRKTGMTPPGWLLGAGLVLVAAAVVLAVVLFLNGDVVPGTLVAVTAAAIFVLALFARAQTNRVEHERARQQEEVVTRQAHGEAALRQQMAHVAALREAIAADAARIGLGPLPSHTEIEDAERRLGEAVAARTTLDARQGEFHDARARETEAIRRAESAAADRDRAEADRDRLLSEWSAWRERQHLPNSLSPQGAVAFLTLIEDGRAKLSALDALETEIATSRDFIEQVNRRIDAIAIALQVPAQEMRSNVAEAIEPLPVRIAADREAREAHATLESSIQEADARITTVLGEETAGSWHDLSLGNPDIWQDAIAEADRRLDALEEERLALARAGKEAELQRRAMEESDETPSLALRRNALFAELQSALHEHRVVTLAEALIRETVKQVERERQPEVLRHASSTFERITAGRYQRVYRPIEGDGLVIEDGEGTMRPPEALSRGTLEQLYVALRLGLATAFTPKVGALPMIMDDVLVNFDPERARGVARALLDVSRDRQVLLFTSQPGTLDVLSGVDGSYAHFAMERHGQGGQWVRLP